jgi:hypothetical protein
MMTRLRFWILVACGVLLLLLGTGATAFYFRIYRPIASPLMAISGARTLEERRLENKGFMPSGSGLTDRQVEHFIDVEESVAKQLTTAGMTLLAQKQADLTRATGAHVVSTRETLAAFGAIKGPYLDAKMAQIDAMNRVHVSKEEFEWVRRQLYRAAALACSQLDVSEILAGERDAGVYVRSLDASVQASEHDERLAEPIAQKLRSWLPLAFFGL